MDLLSQVIIFQKYTNLSSVPIEAKYVFPLDDSAAVCGFEAFINGKHVVGQVKEKETARKEYKQAIEKGHGAYLMDQDAPDVFTISVGNLPPGATVLIKVTFVSELIVSDGGILFSLPGSVAPWQESAALNQTTQVTVEKVCVTDEAASTREFTLDMSVDMPCEITSLKCITHEVKIKRTDCKAVVSVLPGKVMGPEGFQLHITLAKIHLPRMWVEKHPDKDSQACMLVFYPDFDVNSSSACDEVVLLLDTSESMMGESLHMARRIALRVLETLDHNLRVNVIFFGTDHTEALLTTQPLVNARQAAQSFIKCNSPVGGSTELWRPLRALSLLPPSRGVRNLLLLSDGHIQNAELTLQLLRDNSQHSRLFTCGLSPTANRHMLRALAQAGGGAFEFFDTKTKHTWTEKVTRQVKRMASPGCSSVSVKWQQFNPTAPTPVQAPKQLHALFNDCHTLVYGFVPHCTQATLLGNLSGQELKTMVSTSELQKTRGTFLHKLTARALIRDYEDGTLDTNEAEHEGKKAELKHFIVELSKEFSILSQFTSFVAIEERDSEQTEGFTDIPKLIAEEDVDFLPYVSWISSQNDDEDEDMGECLSDGYEIMGFTEMCDDEFSEGLEEEDQQETSDDDISFGDFSFPPPSPLSSLPPPRLLKNRLRRGIVPRRHPSPPHLSVPAGIMKPLLGLQSVEEDKSTKKLMFNAGQQQSATLSLSTLSAITKASSFSSRALDQIYSVEQQFGVGASAESSEEDSDSPSPLPPPSRGSSLAQDLSLTQSEPDFHVGRSLSRAMSSSVKQSSMFVKEHSQIRSPPPPSPCHPILTGAQLCSGILPCGPPPPPHLSVPAGIMEPIYSVQQQARFGGSELRAEHGTSETFFSIAHCGTLADAEWTKESETGSSFTKDRLVGQRQYSLLEDYSGMPSPLPPPPRFSSRAQDLSLTQSEPDRHVGRSLLGMMSSSSSMFVKEHSQIRSPAPPPPPPPCHPILTGTQLCSEILPCGPPPPPHLSGPAGIMEPVHAMPLVLQSAEEDKSTEKSMFKARQIQQLSPKLSTFSGRLLGRQRGRIAQGESEARPAVPKATSLSSRALNQICSGQQQSAPSLRHHSLPQTQFLDHPVPRLPRPYYGAALPGLVTLTQREPEPEGSLKKRSARPFKKRILSERESPQSSSMKHRHQGLSFPVQQTFGYSAHWQSLKPRWTEIFQMQHSEGYWELTTELGEFINVNVDLFANVFLKSKGIHSLGVKAHADILRMVATLLVLQLMRLEKLEEGKLLRTLFCLEDSSQSRPDWWSNVKRAVDWVCWADQQYPCVYSRLEFGSSWESSTRQLLGYEGPPRFSPLCALNLQRSTSPLPVH